MKFTITNSDDGQWYYYISSANGQVMLVSETMKAKKSCLKAIKSIQTKSAKAKIIFA